MARPGVLLSLVRAPALPPQHAYFGSQSHTPFDRCLRFGPRVAATPARLAPALLAWLWTDQTCTGKLTSASPIAPRIRLSDKTSRLLSRATPSAASEHSLELIGFPISRSFTTYCVCLELRSLPSTRVTRFPRYYEPLRHPRAPSLSLTGFRLVIADHALGLPVFRSLSLCTCRRHYPGAASERIASLISSRRISLPR